MNIQKNKSLKNLNTFGIDAKAKFFVELNSKNDFLKLLELLKKHPKYFVLGGGSNILFKDDFDGLVIKPELKGLRIIEKNKSWEVYAQAGENWHEFVKFTVDNSFYGLENLALIPGNVGAAPVQNIGAYGVEQDEYFLELEYYDFNSNEFKRIRNEECCFSYRDSIFKNSLKGKVIITEVVYELKKKFIPCLKYKELKDIIFKNHITAFNQKDVFETVIEIRRNKLPYPDELGNAGSFFKNPVVNSSTLKKLQSKFPEIKSFPFNQEFKLSAGWLIDKAGFKGFRIGDAGVSDKHALILVNHGKATGEDIYSLSEKIIKSVKDKFDVLLEREVNIIH